MKYLLSTIAAMCFLVACESNHEPAHIQVILIDAPADYQAVLIDVQDVQFIDSEDHGERGWTSLEQFEPGVYDLLELTNGNQQVLGNTEYEGGRLSHIRLVLGDRNQLVTEEDTIPLTVPSGSESGLKVHVNRSIEPGIAYKLIVDFDAAKSVVKSGNSGQYILKPVIRAEMEAQSGAISGVLSPSAVPAVIYAIADGDSTSSYPNESGAFLIGAVPEGTYEVVADPGSESEYEPVTISGVNVSVGLITDIDTLKFE